MYNAVLGFPLCAFEFWISGVNFDLWSGLEKADLLPY